MLGGVHIPDEPGLAGNSDADVVLHALTNAVSGISGVNILGEIADDLCMKKGIRDSRVYLKKALETLSGYKVAHVSLSIECARPRLSPHIQAMRAKIAQMVSLGVADVGITATSGEGLSAFGRGEGIQAFAVVTAKNC
jgi:2-C-methyl-D-erythritol 2,4-cyclodiphosphate synthase